MYLYVHYMLDNLNARFPLPDMAIYRLVRCVDPRLRRRPKLGSKTHAECVASLLHFFDLPAHAFVDPRKVIASHKSYLVSPFVDDLQSEHFVLDDQGNQDEESIFPFYHALQSDQGGDTAEWSKFALLCLILATGNAISERGFSAMAAIHFKSRSSLGLPQVLAAMLAAFNGPSYEDEDFF